MAKAVLQWVVHDGDLRHVSEFADLEARKRPKVSCPECGEAVRMKLGAKRRHHVAHEPDSVCAATGPEGALHLNCKLHIANELRKADSLWISHLCSGCNATREWKWVSSWTTVEVEFRLGCRTPDIALLLDAKVVGAIEVFASHAVDREKATALATAGVPWIEVKADEAICDTPWHAGQHLPVLNSSDAWMCSACLGRLERDRKREEQARHQALNHTWIRHVRGVEFYLVGGKKFRKWWGVCDVIRDGHAVEAQLVEINGKLTPIASVTLPANASEQRRMNTAFHEDVRRRGRTALQTLYLGGWKKLDWTRGVDEQSLTESLHGPYRLRWSDRNQRWFEPKRR